MKRILPVLLVGALAACGADGEPEPVGGGTPKTEQTTGVKGTY